MASTFGPRLWRRAAVMAPSARQLGRRMSWNIASAVLIFAIAQIWLVASAVNYGLSMLLAGAVLLLLVIVAIMVAQRLERHWHGLSQAALSSHGLHQRYRRDVRRLWMATLLVPMLWVGGVLLATRSMAAIIG